VGSTSQLILYLYFLHLNMAPPLSSYEENYPIHDALKEFEGLFSPRLRDALIAYNKAINEAKENLYKRSVNYDQKLVLVIAVANAAVSLNLFALFFYVIQYFILRKLLRILFLWRNAPA
jgi:hypothetical protein